jgi:hypothetical protein
MVRATSDPCRRAPPLINQGPKGAPARVHYRLASRLAGVRFVEPLAVGTCASL